MAPEPIATPRRDPLRVWALIITAVLHVGVLGFLWVQRALAARAPKPGVEHFVDATLVRFGKPRDLSFLPHKRGVVREKGPEPQIKVARDINQLPRLDKDNKPEVVDPLKRTHAEQFKHLNDEPEGVETNEGQLTGSRAGTAAEASGDPYIAQIKGMINWTIPTTIPDQVAARLVATACMKIADSGALQRFEIRQGSGNSQFDSSLQGALGLIKQFPPPPDRFRGKLLCADFSKNQ
jgi:TonB-like protein